MTNKKNDIAVIGIGCRFPDADNSDVFFQNLIANKDSIKEIPRERWDYKDLYSRNGNKNRIKSKWGGFISGVDKFDARFFKILPSEAELLDPQQKLFLTCSWEALEDAGYTHRSATASKQVGVYAGVTWNEYSLLSNEYGYLNGEYKGGGALYWGIPNRVSYFFDFTGPSIAVDTACSSSIVALHLASQGLCSGECEMALAGGVNLNLHPAKYLFLSASNFLSTEGKCRSFGEKADGYVPSEGVAVLVLKTLNAAVAAGDRIYGVIKATATKHGGNATGYTVPNPRAHKEVIQTVLQRANVNPRDISYVECHGTGTDLGDPIEIAGLRLAYEASTQDKQFCGIGSVKSNIGHCEATAGLAGLIKVLLSMQAGFIPATLHANVPNKKIDFNNSPFYLVQENSPWKTNNGMLLAGLSSFGAGGSNCHCIVQSYVPQKIECTKINASILHMAAISSLNADRTLAYCKKLRKFLQEKDVSITDLCYTLTKRKTFEHRVVFLADSIKTLLGLLDFYVDSGKDDKVIVSPDAEMISSEIKELSKLASQWIDGETKLQQLPLPAKGKLISLPGYAFEKSRLWIDPSLYLYQKQTYADFGLHPLIDSNASTAVRGVFNKSLDRSEYYVDEHWIKDEPVLPGVCLVEMVLFAAQTYLELNHLGLFDVWFLEPIALSDIDSVDIQVEITSPSSEPCFEIFSNQRNAKNATGKVRSIEYNTAMPEAIDLENLFSHCENTISPNQLYSRFADSEIIQKNRFKVISKFRFNEYKAVAELTQSDEFLVESRYGMNPTLLDGAIQTAIVHMFQQQPQTATILPFQIGSFVRFHPLASKVVVCATLKNLDAKKYDIIICDQLGNVLVQIKDFVLKEYKDKQLKNRPLIFSPVFQECQLFSVGASIFDSPPVCVLSELPTSCVTEDDIPSHWFHIKWGHDFNQGQNMTSWIENSVEKVPRIAIIIDELKGGETGDTVFQIVSNGAKNLFNFVQLIMRTNRSIDVIVCVMGESKLTKTFAHACGAFLKCLNLELPKNRFRLLELVSVSNVQDLFGLFVKEFMSTQGDFHVRYKLGKRFVPKLHAVKCKTLMQDEHRDPPAWIVTGAGGYLGMIVSHFLLMSGKRVILIGRSALDESKRKALLEFSNDNWQYLQCDLTNKEQVNKAVETAMGDTDNIWGIVHCAGRIADGAFLKKEWSTFESVIRAKVESLLLLCDSLSKWEISRIILFSSLTSLIGNKGQADYAFANGFLDGFASLAKELIPSQPIVTSMNWPYWEEGGMKINAGKLPGYIDTFSTQPLPTSVGLELFEWMLTIDNIQAGMVYSIAKLDRIEKKLLLKSLPGQQGKSSKHDTHAQLSPASIENGRPEKKMHEIQQYLLCFLENELKLNLTEHDLQVEFSDLGVDSIAKMDLIAKLEKEKRFEDIPQALLEENTTIASLSDFFYENYYHANYFLN